jgi:uncharacterized protein
MIDWSEEGLASGLRCYCNEEFFDAHEHWEAVWLRCTEPDKTFLQALIQVTAAFHHLRRGNPAGTKALLRAALGRLEKYPPEYGGVAVGTLRRSIGNWLEALDVGSLQAGLSFPTIR